MQHLKTFIILTVFLCLTVGQAYAEKLNDAGILSMNKHREHSQTCPFLINFGSYASGADIHAFKQITDYLNQSDHVTSGHIWYWGKEGERTICITRFDKRFGKKLFADIRAYLVASPVKTPTSIQYGEMTFNDTRYRH